MIPISNQSSARGSGWVYVALSLLALAISGAVVLLFAYLQRDMMRHALPLFPSVVAVAAAGANAWMFLKCPQRPVLPKLLTLLVLILNTNLGLECLLSYVFFKNEIG